MNFSSYISAHLVIDCQYIIQLNFSIPTPNGFFTIKFHNQNLELRWLAKLNHTEEKQWQHNYCQIAIDRSIFDGINKIRLYMHHTDQSQGTTKACISYLTHVHKL